MLKIGVFDSGVGGLSVLAPIRQYLPTAHLIYVADTAHLPYGNKSDRYIEQRVLKISQFLIDQGCDALVVACNTATAAAVAAVRLRHALPVIGLEPAIKPAVASSHSKVIGVLATEFTVHSARFAALKQRFEPQAQILVQPCPGLVEQVEAGRLLTDDTKTLLSRLLAPLLAAGADRLVLGCTHYPFLKPLLTQLLPPSVQVLDPGDAIARELLRRLQLPLQLQPASLNPIEQPGPDDFWCTAQAERLNQVLPQLWPVAAEFQLLTEPVLA